MFFRLEERSRYEQGRALGHPLTPYGDTLTIPIRRYRHLYEAVQDESRRTGEPFGKIILRNADDAEYMRAFTGCSAAFWAHLCEEVRRQSYPDLPSRLDSVFAFRSLGNEIRIDEVFRWESQVHRQNEMQGLIIYEVITKEDQISNKFDMTIIDILNANLDFEQNTNIISKYWNGDKSDSPMMVCLLKDHLLRGDMIKSLDRSSYRKS
ncbi:MAG TPA: hypothetical protein VF463_06505 [Sphingobium sp.]